MLALAKWFATWPPNKKTVFKVRETNPGLRPPEEVIAVYSYDAGGAKLTEQYPDHTSGSTPGQLGYAIVTTWGYRNVNLV